MDESKLIKIFPAFKVSPEMHEAVSSLAKKHNRKMTDQVRYLIEKGLESEVGTDIGSRMDLLETEMHTMREQLARYVSLSKIPRKKAAS